MSALTLYCIVGAVAIVAAVVATCVAHFKRRHRVRLEAIRELEPEVGPAMAEISRYFNFGHYITESERIFLVNKYQEMIGCMIPKIRHHLFPSLSPLRPRHAVLRKSQRTSCAPSASAVASTLYIEVLRLMGIHILSLSAAMRGMVVTIMRRNS